MGPLLIIKVALGTLIQAIDLVGNLIPEGKLKNILDKVEEVGRQAQDILSKALLEAGESEEGQDYKAQLAKLPSVTGEG